MRTLHVSRGGCDGMSKPRLGFLVLFRAMPQTTKTSEEELTCLRLQGFGSSREGLSEGMQMGRVTWKMRRVIWTSRKSTKLMLAWLHSDSFEINLVEQRQCLPAATLQLSLSFYAIFDLYRHLVARCEGISGSRGTLMYSLLDLFLMNAQSFSLTFLAVYCECALNKSGIGQQRCSEEA